jgi:hypothetical protein
MNCELYSYFIKFLGFFVYFSFLVNSNFFSIIGISSPIKIQIFKQEVITIAKNNIII